MAQTPDQSQPAGTKEKLAEMIQYGRSAMIKQKFDEALDVLRAGASIARLSSLDSFTSRILINMGVVYRYKGLYDSSIRYLKMGEQIADQKQYTTLQAAANLELFATYNMLGKTDSARARITYLQSVIPKLDSNSSERAKIELYLGHANTRNAKYSQAYEHYRKALDIFTALKDSVNMAVCLNSFGNVFNDRQEQDKALPYFREAVTILRQLGRRSELANALINLTDNYFYLNQLDSAEVTAKEALEIGNQVNEKNFQSYAYLNLGQVFRKRGQHAKAERYFLKTLQLGEEINSDNVISGAYQGLGEIYMEGQPKKAEGFLEKHLALAQQTRDYQEIIEAYADLKENEYNLHNYAKAHEYEKLYASYKDSAYNESVNRNIADMESKYESEKKEKEIALLKKDQELKNIELQKERTTKLSAFILLGLLLIIGLLVVNRYRVIQNAKRMVEIEKLRNNIARDLHDDIGSVLSSININSKMALSHTGQDVIVKNQLEKIKEYSGRMMEGMSDIVWAINPINDSMEKMIVRMKEFAIEMLDPQNINFTFNHTDNFAESVFDVRMRKDIYMVFKEALNNAAKYSDCKNLVIDLELLKDNIHLSISDDGKGFDKSQVRPGNGLRNMEQRIKAIGGNINIISARNKGTTVELDIPIA